MSHDDYVNHIFQKYRLALSISVIKTKPEELTLEQYIQLLRSKINKERTNLDDLNFSVCSDDFQIDETGQFYMNVDENDFNINAFNDQTAENAQKIEIDCGLPINTDEFSDKNQFNEARYARKGDICHEIDKELINTQDLNESTTILQNFEAETTDLNNIQMETDQRQSFENVIEILKSIDDDITTIEQGISNVQSTYRGNSESLSSKCTDTIKYVIDNDGTLCESSEVSSNVDQCRVFQERSYHSTNNRSPNHKGSQIKKMNTKTDDTKESIIKPKINQSTNDITEFDTSTSEMETKCTNEKHQNENNQKFALNSQSIRHYRNAKGIKNIFQNVANIFDATKSKNLHQHTKVHNSNNLPDNYQQISSETQDVVMSTPDDFKCTQYSESQIHDLIIIDDRFIHGTSKNNSRQQNKDAKQLSVIEKSKHITDKILLKETEQTNFLALRMNKTNLSTNEIKNENNCKEFSKRKTMSINKYVSSQDIPLPIFLNSTNNSKISDNYNIKQLKNVESYKELQDKSDISQHYKNSKRTVKYIDNSLFSQESEITNCSTIPTNNNHNLSENRLAFSQDAQKFEEYFDRSRIQKSQELELAIEANNDRSKDVNNKSCTGFDKNSIVSDQIDKSTYCDNNSKNIHIHTTNQHDKKAKVTENNDHKSCDNFDNHFDNRQVTATCSKMNTILDGMQITETVDDFEENLEDMEELTDSQIEVIPFKVIEELNKIKLYLNRSCEKKSSLDRHSSDQGYKSDSQSRQSFKLSQSSTVVLDQSAHCILNYILECPLMETTQDITNEISVVLGQLIDKLHYEEKYPSFLEDLLEGVQLLLRLVCEDSSDENTLMKKDEIIQRILLLNKSVHIQKYTIEKITSVLENMHKELTTNDSMYEAKHIDQIENMCYVFHILESILQKHNKISKNLSQNTAQSNSQDEEKILKKSNIMDIWKKKWNPNYKEIENAGSSEKACSLNSCNSVLNKLIVDCMDGYSLISYFALKCFNIMQT